MSSAIAQDLTEFLFQLFEGARLALSHVQEHVRVSIPHLVGLRQRIEQQTERIQRVNQNLEETRVFFDSIERLSSLDQLARRLA